MTSGLWLLDYFHFIPFMNGFEYIQVITLAKPYQNKLHVFLLRHMTRGLKLKILGGRPIFQSTLSKQAADPLKGYIIQLV